MITAGGVYMCHDIHGFVLICPVWGTCFNHEMHGVFVSICRMYGYLHVVFEHGERGVPEEDRVLLVVAAQVRVGQHLAQDRPNGNKGGIKITNNFISGTHCLGTIASKSL